MIKIYKIVSNDSNKIYIGSTKTSLKRRLSNHRAAKKRNENEKKNEILDNCEIRLIEECDKSLRLIRERFWIEFYRSSIYFECVNRYIPIQYRNERLNYQKNYSKIKVKCNYCENLVRYGDITRHVKTQHPIFVMDLFN